MDPVWSSAHRQGSGGLLVDEGRQCRRSQQARPLKALTAKQKRELPHSKRELYFEKLKGSPCRILRSRMDKSSMVFFKCHYKYKIIFSIIFHGSQNRLFETQTGNNRRGLSSENEAPAFLCCPGFSAPTSFSGTCSLCWLWLNV